MPRFKHKPRFSREACRKGGSRAKGYETADDARQRILQDAKGMVLREGVTYSADGERHWQKRRALFGRTDQIEIVCDGAVVATTGESLLRNSWRWLRGE